MSICFFYFYFQTIVQLHIKLSIQIPVTRPPGKTSVLVHCTSSPPTPDHWSPFLPSPYHWFTLPHLQTTAALSHHLQTTAPLSYNLQITGLLSYNLQTTALCHHLQTTAPLPHHPRPLIPFPTTSRPLFHSLKTVDDRINVPIHQLTPPTPQTFREMF